MMKKYELIKAMVDASDYTGLWLILGSCMSAANNMTPEDEEVNDGRLKEFLEALELFECPTEEIVRAKTRVAEYLQFREDEKQNRDSI